MINYLSDIRQGTKVRDTKDNKVYDFGYWSNKNGWAIVYKEGERNFQDSIGIPCDDLEILSQSNELVEQRERLKRAMSALPPDEAVNYLIDEVMLLRAYTVILERGEERE